MIEVYYDQSETEFYLSICGHANYAENGKDVVCAGVSTLAYTLAEYLSVEDFDIPLHVSFNDGAAEISCHATEDNVVRIQAAFDFAMTGIKVIAQEYPSYVVVKGE